MVYSTSYTWSLLPLLFLLQVNLHTARVTVTNLNLNKLNNETILSENETVDDVNVRQEKVLPSSDMPQTTNCESCSTKKEQLSDEEAKKFRTEVIKRHILKELNLEEVPDMPKLPESRVIALIEATGMGGELQKKEKSDEEEVETIALYPTDDDDISCNTTKTVPCTKYRFQFPKDKSISHRDSAVIWLYKKDSSNILDLTHVFTNISEDRIINKINPIPAQESTHNPRLVKVTIPPPSSWITTNDSTVFDIEIVCFDCDGKSSSAVSELDNEVPFVVVTAVRPPPSSRRKRDTVCPENSTGCCKHHLEISFAEIGWDNWIIQPPGYSADYCKGSCESGINKASHHHATIITRYSIYQPEKMEENDIRLCCTASKLSSLDLLYRTPNDTVYKRNVEYMKVEECSCA